MKVLTLLAFIVIAYLPALSGVIWSPGAWYAQLNKPSWTPPPWVFAPVWTAIYALIAISGFIAWVRTRPPQRWRTFRAYGAQLVLNGLWSWLFFGLHSPGWAALDIAFLWLAIVVNIAAFARVSPTAANLLTPYLLWVSYAATLNFGIAALN